MKQFLAFIAVFLTVLTIGYLEPVFFPAEQVKVVTDDGYGGRSVSHTALPYEELETSGYATYIGKKVTEFVKSFGEPINKIVTSFDYDIWVFGTTDEDYLELNVRENKILAIKAFNNSKQTAPFYNGMALSDVSELTTIYSNFAFTYNEQQYDIELMEEDMNYRPLIAFDNGTFAILFFNYGTSKLSAVVYLDKESLLTLMPYQLAEDNALPVVSEVSLGFDSDIADLMMRVINLLKVREGLAPYSVTAEGQKNAQMLFDLLMKKPKNIFTADRLESWQQSEDQSVANHPFTLTNDEFQDLLSAGKLDSRKSTGLYTEPIYDPSVTVLLWSSDSLYHSRFSHNQKENIGVAFSKANVLVLLQVAEKEISQTGESE